ncbi:MAG: hypothetical protein A2086_12105 [Spirochaetes bacterium GWD1_27_9]|nr:MAG: hypothetical protein A2Z98_03055 [Spirochaetes bacterium GWB1_27_13]OHD22932.1 MAG: hypothetical protein A2Y34_09165 [Spirochaetes bacterium GWC1_27_15]OHD28973.1 MAG: hypothetical protein A2086_12105 [Spirochaetes bacterium GWD1_27_9]
MVKKIFLSLFLIFSIYFICVAEVDIKIYSNKNSLLKDEIFQISVEISGANGVSFSDIENLDPAVKINQSGTMSNFSFINGVATSSQTITFVAKITKEGEYNLGPFVFNIGGKLYKTEILKLKVSNSSKDNRNAESQNNEENEADDSNYNTNERNNSNYLIKLNVNKKEVYVNEAFDVSVQFYNREELQNPSYEPIKFPSSAWIENFNAKDNYRGVVNINNIMYHEYVIEKKKVYISKEGELTINPAVFSFMGYKGNGFFSYPEQISLKTNSFKITVKPLPPNAPNNFYGIVGNFSITSRLTPQTVKAKEPATLKISLSGDGNFQNIKDIGYQIIDNIEEYSSKSNVITNGNQKTKEWEILLVPKKEGDYKIRVNDFSYFDPAKKEYITLSGNEFNLSALKGEEKDNETIIIHNDKKNDSIDENLKEISYIKTNFGNKNTLFSYQLCFNLILSIYIISIIVIFVFVFTKFFLFNLSVNKEEILRKNAYKTFLKEVKLLENSLKKDFSDKIMDKISLIIEKYFISKYKLDSVEFTKNTINDKLSKFLSEKNLEVLKNIFVELDIGRFGGFDITKESILNLITMVKNLMENIEGQNNEK